MVSRRFDGWKKARMSVSALIKMEQNHVGVNGLVSTFSSKIPSAYFCRGYYHRKQTVSRTFFIYENYLSNFARLRPLIIGIIRIYREICNVSNCLFQVGHYLRYSYKRYRIITRVGQRNARETR